MWLTKARKRVGLLAIRSRKSVVHSQVMIGCSSTCRSSRVNDTTPSVSWPRQSVSPVDRERYDTVSELAGALRVSIAVVANLRKRLRRWFKRQMRDGEDQP